MKSWLKTTSKFAVAVRELEGGTLLDRGADPMLDGPGGDVDPGGAADAAVLERPDELAGRAPDVEHGHRRVGGDELVGDPLGPAGVAVDLARVADVRRAAAPPGEVRLVVELARPGPALDLLARDHPPDLEERDGLPGRALGVVDAGDQVAQPGVVGRLGHHEAVAVQPEAGVVDDQLPADRVHARELVRGEVPACRLPQRAMCPPVAHSHAAGD
jgi:hypothetical protein